MDALCNILTNAESYSVDKAAASSYGAIYSLIMTSLMMGAFPWLKRWALFVWFALLIAITTYFGITSSLGMAEGLYGACCGIMAILSQMLGMTYIQACGIENIYVHSLLPTLFAIPAAYVGMRNIKNKERMALVAGLFAVLNLLCCFSVTYAVWSVCLKRSLHGAVVFVVHLLQSAGSMVAPGWGGYVMINMLIYVVLFLLSALISWLLYRWVKCYDIKKIEQL